MRMNSPPASPAQAALASSLESLEKTKTDYQHHWQTGIPSLDESLPPDLWTSGKVIGIIDDSHRTASPDPSEVHVTPLVTQLVVTHLATIHNDFAGNTTTTSLPPPTSVYIITSLSTSSAQESAVSPSCLATALAKSSLPPSLLDSVSLLQYFDFAGLADAVGEVSVTFFTYDQPLRRHSSQQPNSSTANSPLRGTNSILILDGLIPTLSTLNRRSGPVATNALLTSLLRSLTHLSRGKPDTCTGEALLILVLLEPGFLDGLPGSGSGSGGKGEEMSAFSMYATGRQEERRRGKTKQQQHGDYDVAGGCQAGLGRTDSLATAMGVLASGLDSLVLVHAAAAAAAEGRDVVEVLSDRLGNMTGRWAVRDENTHPEKETLTIGGEIAKQEPDIIISDHLTSRA